MRTEVDSTTYRNIYEDQRDWFIRKGYFIDHAEMLAREMMELTFVSREANLQCEYEADYAEYVYDMERGGDKYGGR